MTEHKTVFRWWWAWSFDKEEQWLNDMAMEGWALDSVVFCIFGFSRCEPGEYTVRLEMRPDNSGYLQLMRDIGAEYIGRCMQWIYFRRKSELGAFDIFSDLDSRIAHLERIAAMLRVIGVANIIIGTVNAMLPSSVGIANLLCACLLMYGLGRIRGKEDELKKERTLHE